MTEHGHKELVEVEDGLRESEASWTELLLGMHARGLDKSASGLAALPKSVHPKLKEARIANGRPRSRNPFNRRRRE